MKTTLRLIAILWVASAGAASAQNMKPGLWEIRSQMQGGAGGKNDELAQMQKELQGMSPDERKMVEAMMAKQGVSVSAAPGGGMAMKVCMTKEMVERNDMPSQQGDCKHSYSPRSGNTMKFSFACTKPPSSGEGSITFTSPEAYSTRMRTASGTPGRQEKMDLQSSGRWLGADCGSIKPIVAPK